MTGEGESASAHRPERLLGLTRGAWLLALLCLASLPFLVHPWYDATNDGSMYIASARSLLRGEGYSFLGEAFRIRPPGMAVLLASVLALFDASFVVLNTTVALFGVLAAVALFLFARPRIGEAPAFALALVLWLNPGMQRACNQVMSDAPGVALLLSLLVLARRTERSPTLVKDVLLAIGIAAAAYVRSINVLLVPALVVARLLAGRGELSWGSFLLRRLLPVPLVVFAAMLPWSLRNAAHAPPPPADQTFLYSYGSGMWHADAGDPRSPRLGIEEILGRVPTRASQLTEVLGSRQSSVIPSRHRFLAGGEARKRTRGREVHHHVLGALLLVAIVIGFARRREMAETFGLGASALLLVYFGFDDRLALPVFAVAAIAASDTAHGLLARVAGERVGRRVLTVLLIAWAWTDFRPREEWSRIEAQHELFASIAAEAEEHLPADARLGALVGWHLGVYLDRSVHSLNWAIAREGKDPRAAEAVIDRYGLNTILLSPAIPVDRIYAGYFLERYAGRVTKLENGYLIRVRS